jgi:fatty-acyl-CoA synthase
MIVKEETPVTVGDMDQLRLERSRRLVLGEILARTARSYPHKVALIFQGQQRTFAELDERVNRLANALAQRGVGRGVKVAVLMYNCLEGVESYFACQKLGACPVPTNFRLVKPEVQYILENSDSVGIIADEQLAQTASAAFKAVDSVRFHLAVGAAPEGAEAYEEALAAASPREPELLVAQDDLAFLMYTSGTTGLPKGAMLTHQNLVMNTINWTHEIEARRDDVWLSGLPLFHIGGVNGVLPFIYVGGTCVITPSTHFDPEESLRLIQRHNVTMCYFVPTQWQQICALPEVKNVDTSKLRKALWGASVAPRSTLELLTSTFPNVGIVNAFGQTEMSSNTTFLKPEDAVRKMGSVGKPAINVEVRIVDDNGDDVPQGDVGEIVYRGPTVMAGYYRNPAATQEAFKGGWFHSGDLVRADQEGFIYVVDRKKDMIISGGENIYPNELERVFMQHPGVRDVAVIGVPHPKWVETPVAVVVRQEGVDVSEDELIAFCRQNLASYKKPSAVAFTDELPRNAAGKVLKRDLRDKYRSMFSGERP